MIQNNLRDAVDFSERAAWRGSFTVFLSSKHEGNLAILGLRAYTVLRIGFCAHLSIAAMRSEGSVVDWKTWKKWFNWILQSPRRLLFKLSEKAMQG